MATLVAALALRKKHFLLPCFTNNDNLTCETSTSTGNPNPSNSYSDP